MGRPQRLARDAEKKTAQLHGGKVTPASGSGQTVKNDVRNADWSFEVKLTTKKTYSLSHAALEDAEKNALADGRKMAFVVAFKPGQAYFPPGKRYVVTTEDDWMEREMELTRLREEREHRRAV